VGFVPTLTGSSHEGFGKKKEGREDEELRAMWATREGKEGPKTPQKRRNVRTAAVLLVVDVAAGKKIATIRRMGGKKKVSAAAMRGR